VLAVSSNDILYCAQWGKCCVHPGGAIWAKAFVLTGIKRGPRLAYLWRIPLRIQPSGYALSSAPSGLEYPLPVIQRISRTKHFVLCWNDRWEGVLAWRKAKRIAREKYSIETDGQHMLVYPRGFLIHQLSCGLLSYQNWPSWNGLTVSLSDIEKFSGWLFD